MASDIQRMLEISTKIEKGETQQQRNRPTSVSSQRELDKLIENYDNALYGPNVEPIMAEQQYKKYDAKEEMEHLKKIQESGGRPAVNLEGRNIPRGIVESILNDPLDIPTEDTEMDKFTNQLSAKMKGVKKAVDVFNNVEKLEESNRQKINEQLNPKPNVSSSIDYELIKQLIESAIDKKLETFKQTLNESVSNKQSYIPSMKCMNFKDKFLFLDNDDNIFECEMKYKGKRKKK